MNAAIDAKLAPYALDARVAAISSLHRMAIASMLRCNLMMR